MQTIQHREWKQIFKNVDKTLAEKYQTRPSIIKFIRTSSLNQNWTIQKIAHRALGLKNAQKGKAGRNYFQEMVDFITSLSKDDWEDITRPNGQAIDYMIS